LGTPQAMEAALAWYRTEGLRTDLGRIAVPTLYVWGDEDHSVTAMAAEGTAAFVSGPYRFVSLPGVGHFSTDEVPARINELLLEHIAANRA
jgi:pimeloyl-ACP methyl ester carboxylesterase